MTAALPLPEIDEFSDLIKGTRSLTVKIVETLLHLRELPVEFFIEFNARSTGANKAVVSPDPSDRLRRLHAAMRAFDRELGFVKSFHNGLDEEAIAARTAVFGEVTGGSPSTAT